MALLRMLAFVPAGSGEGRVERSRAPAAAAAGAQAPSGLPTRPAPAGAAASPAISDWRELVTRLKLGGMARMLAQHSEIASLNADRLELRVPEAHKHLLDKPYRDKLQAALEEHLGQRLKLDFVLGQAAGMTPAEQEDKERQARLQQAVQAIDGDPFVRELVENFDARVVDESIRPLDGR
jgi:DNA polymerase-3 subunit gamma/tau